MSPTIDQMDIRSRSSQQKSRKPQLTQVERHDEDDERSSEQKILAMVREQLQRPNPPGTEALYGRAALIDESIRELSLRQFNARYVLRVHRQMAREKEVDTRDVEAPEGAALPERPPADRSALRQLFYDLAAEVAETETGPELIDFYDRGLDRYVDRILATLPSG